ncbi:hypothetical protein H312_00100 [Anncaliia algerae PRA339]|uniref:Uncharacterized protein n=1 Tax=Anncaliia algerae PRA339 TaxID=1288291 RepID=A0A059F5Q1_9MICR|nr:hypothetical protein H312_00100 [Anncaliia algerae PRA339]
MISSSRVYTFFFFFYFLKILGFVIYIKFIASFNEKIGIRISPFGVYLTWLSFVNAFITFLLLTNVFVSQKVNMYIPYIILEGNAVIVSIALLPFVGKGYHFIAFVCPLFIEYFLILYAFDKDIKTAKYVEAQKFGLNVLAQRALKVSLKLIR